MLLNNLKENIKQWSRNKSWFLPAGLVVLYGFFGFHYILDPHFMSFIDSFNLLIHELGHVVFGFLGMTIGIAGGTILQLLVPILTLVQFWGQRDYTALSFPFFWLATHLFNIAIYIEDAQRQSLVLISLGYGEPIHDWNYLLYKIGLIEYAMPIANFVRILGYAFLLIACMYGAWILILVLTNRQRT
jgi:hypothetical protein